MTETLAIVQARMGSTRLPGKVLMYIAGQPMLRHVIERLKHAKLIDTIVIATSANAEDKPVVELANKIKTKSYAGSPNDVLDRYYQAATLYKADVVVRITADCPLIDPQVVDKVVKHYREGKFDYVSNVVKPTYPDGLDTEVFSYRALAKAWQEAKLTSEREHVTPYIWKNTGMFRIGGIENVTDYSGLRWTVDDSKDLEFIREIYRYLYHKNKMFYMEDVLELLKQRPELLKINQGTARNEGYTKSVLEDKIVK
jgi:spore coat polysaccharide biosynthesis protein SpsF